MMGWIWFLVIGLVAGLLARLIMPGKDAMGLIATMILGIIGSLLGGAVSYYLFGAKGDAIQPSGLIMSIVGAIIVLAIWRLIKSRSTV